MQGIPPDHLLWQMVANEASVGFVALHAAESSLLVKVALPTKKNYQTKATAPLRHSIELTLLSIQTKLVGVRMDDPWPDELPPYVLLTQMNAATSAFRWVGISMVSI